MNKLRSIAFCAIALLAGAFMSMPANASVPIEPGIHALASQGICHPSPAIFDVDHVAIAADRQVDAASSHVLVRSTPITQIASSTPSVGRKLSPIDIRMRC
ncbi:hypothetical protein EQW76_00770 [Rhizobium sp. rho-13.1]|uniref:hypothetical protein n=1 Tax=Rhizobium sp. rho-13.1 TaxID=2506431 RepID=UPI00115C9506|nr:hypothetical protein [Rhizobium sp. rho-13.1]TQX91301.1 hypothetical protein EQW76_00770 [Rhizobium sp. rho-13.1]